MKLLKLDMDRQTPVVNRMWEFGVNTCHAPLWLRRDLPLQLREEHETLGFRYVRFHGVLNDDMGVVHADGSFHFERVIEVYEKTLNAGFRPFIELSSMPTALASSDSSVCFYRFISAPPRDWRKWYDLIHAFTQALTEHFGREAVREWYFEVWNEPDIPFWEGSMAEYFKLYDLARRAVKSVCPEYRVGGPATSKTKWIPEFITHVTTPSADDPEPGIRCDFISTHAYPSDLAFLDAAEGSVELQEASILRTLCAAARKEIDQRLGAGVPLIFGEWNSSAGPFAFNHDECNNAAFICKTMTEVRASCQGSMYWNATDIYEENDFHYTPFHGGYGLMNVNSFPKSSFHAFRFLRETGEMEIAASFDESCEEHGMLASRSGDELRLLVWNYRQPGTDGVPLDFRIADLPAVSGTMERIEPGHGSAYETWLELGKPDFLNRQQFDQLAQAAQTTVQSLKSDQIVTIPCGCAALLKFRI